MLEHRALGRPETEGRHPVTIWPAGCTPGCLRGFAAGYAIRDAGVPELAGPRPYR